MIIVLYYLTMSNNGLFGGTPTLSGVCRIASAMGVVICGFF